MQAAATRPQAKLKVGASGDESEREADRLAQQVTTGSRCACAGACTKCQRKIQRWSDHGSAGTANVDPVLRGPSHPLDPASRAFFEPRFGHDFSGVRVHTDRAAAASADALSARAYTVGNHVVFGANEYRPGTADGRRLLAHELTHVMQQGASGALRVQREEKPPKPKPGSAETAPQLRLLPAEKQPPGACLVFMHHDERGALLTAQAMHRFCRYNLAIVDAPAKAIRTTKLPKKGEVDPNGLFPRDVAAECWNDPAPCKKFMEDNKGSTDKDVIEQYAQRQYFVTMWDCSKGFTLPVIALHNNALSDSAAYRAAMPKEEKLKEIRGKAFDDTVQTAKPDDVIRPFSELETWMDANIPNVDKKPEPKAGEPKPKQTVQSPTLTKEERDAGKAHMLTPKQTNIFYWCSADDNEHCYIGDPSRPDAVVWTTNRHDFEKLRGSKQNVVLQTRVKKGDSATDLSSVFVSLHEIIGEHNAKIIEKLKADLTIDINELDAALKELETPKKGGKVDSAKVEQLEKRLRELITRAKWITIAEGWSQFRLSQLRFINIETAPKGGTGAERSTNYVDHVKATLAPLGLDFCDAAAHDEVVKALKAGKLPPKEKEKEAEKK